MNTYALPFGDCEPKGPGKRILCEFFRVTSMASKSKKNSKSSPKQPEANGKAKASASKNDAPTIQLISQNRKVRHHYQILDTVECGMILVGSEVKSLRDGKCQLDEAYGRIKGDTLWLLGCNIAEYPQATIWNHEPKRHRQLLIRKREMSRFQKKAKEKGLTLVPLRMYFNQRGIAKCELALCKGLKLHDKREKMKSADAQRDMQRAMRGRRI